MKENAERGPLAEPKHGKKPNQKMKPYVVLQYLLRNTDEDHVESATQIVGYLQECGIAAERRSIYRDIEEINLVALMMDEDCSVEEAEEMLADDEDDELKLVVYDKAKKGFYVRQRHFDLNDIRLLAECVYSSKFIAEGQAKRLVDVVCEFVSEHQAEKIRHNAFLVDRIKTTNRSVLNNIAIINDAMSHHLDGFPHDPEKISFKYLKHSIGSTQQVERRHGERYVVSPYQLLINDGNYYLLAFDERAQKMRTYRVDRMKDVSAVGEPREGEEAFRAIDLKTYTQRVFSMYGGTRQRITLRFINPLLDTVVERFGSTARYLQVDDNHFEVTVEVEVSDQFFGWLLGFGKRAKLIAPESAVAELSAYLDKIQEMYES